jgi:hypothetical protein
MGGSFFINQTYLEHSERMFTIWSDGYDSKSFFDLMQIKYGYKCEDLFHSCKLGRKVIDCCGDLFIPRSVVRRGLCYQTRRNVNQVYNLLKYIKVHWVFYRQKKVTLDDYYWGWRQLLAPHPSTTLNLKLSSTSVTILNMWSNLLESTSIKMNGIMYISQQNYLSYSNVRRSVRIGWAECIYLKYIIEFWDYWKGSSLLHPQLDNGKSAKSFQLYCSISGGDSWCS